MSALHIQLFGDFRIVYGAEPVPGIDTPRLQSVLAYLLLHRDAPQSRAFLSYLFWPNSSETQARVNLRKQLYHLRRALPEPAALHIPGRGQWIAWGSRQPE